MDAAVFGILQSFSILSEILSILLKIHVPVHYLRKKLKNMKIIKLRLPVFLSISLAFSLRVTQTRPSLCLCCKIKQNHVEQK